MENICPACNSNKLSHQLSSYGFDSSEELYDLYRCSDCAIVSTHPFLSSEKLSAYYHSDYYGGESEKSVSKTSVKFNPIIEAVVRFNNSTRGQKLVSLLNSQKDKKLPPVKARILDVGCGRG